jgi:signal transduction histidine kinase
MLNPAQPSQDKILALSSEIALACDADGIVLWADARAVRLLGARPPVPFVSLVAHGTEDKALRFQEQALCGETDPWELVLVADGTPVVVAWRGAPTPDGVLMVGNLVPQELERLQEQVAGAMGELALLQRETERQRRLLSEAHAEIQNLLVAERLARAQAETQRWRLQQVVDRLPEAIVIADADGRLANSNAAAAEILGLDLSGLAMPVGDEPWFNARHFDGTSVSARDLPLQRSALRGEVVLGEQLLLRGEKDTGEQDKREVPVLVNSAPLFDATGQPAGAVAVFQDITAIKDLNHQKDEFLATVSHDLRNPLAGIKGWTQLLIRRARRLPEAERERWAHDLATIDGTAGRMAAMIDDLLDLTQLQMGRPLELHREPTDLVALARRVAADHQQLAEAHTIVVQSELPSIEGMWDPSRVERVVGNLVSNAIKYSPNGGDVLLTVGTQATAAGAQATLSIHDNGVGIPTAELPRVFARFYRGSNLASSIAGTGIGLAGAKQLIEQHGGTIGVVSVQGQGSTFLVQLPLLTPRA